MTNPTIHPVDHLVESLQLLPHPEGGFYKETYRASEGIEQQHLPKRFGGNRSFGTGIYFLLTAGNFSAFHRIQSDEMWHFYSGDCLEIVSISPAGELTTILLGSQLDQGEVFQAVVPAQHWFASRVRSGGSHALVGCSVAPGFDFADFELANRQELSQAFPQHSSLIAELTR